MKLQQLRKLTDRERRVWFAKNIDNYELVEKVHNNCGNCLYASGDVQAAIAQYRSALKYEPDHPQAGPNLARLLESSQRK